MNVALAKKWIGPVMDIFPAGLRDTALVRGLGLLKIPVIYYVRPSVIEMTDERVEIKIPLRRRTKNHLNSMYFGVLAIGADVSGGMLAMKAILQSDSKIELVFKDFKADFLRKAMADVHFTSEDGKVAREMIAETLRTGERVNRAVNIVATCPSLSPEPVAKFVLTLSLKAKG